MLPLELPVTTFSTFSELESNSSAVASSFVITITLGTLALTWITDGVNLWSLSLSVMPASANAGALTHRAANRRDKRIIAAIPGIRPFRDSLVANHSQVQMPHCRGAARYSAKRQS